MNTLFDGLTLPRAGMREEYDSGRGCFTLRFDNASRADFENCCRSLEAAGCTLFDGLDIPAASFRTYRGKIFYFVSFDEPGTLRVTADPFTAPVSLLPEAEGDHRVTLWQFEVDHSLIDCGMCYVVRCSDGSFFMIDSAHFYSVNDDIRLIAFLKKLTGGEKPVVSGWFFSHGHEDHVDKFIDVLKHHGDEIEIKAVYWNFLRADHRDSENWFDASKASIIRFEKIMDENPGIRQIRLHSGQRFYVGNLKFTVLCTHEDVWPESFEDFNDSSVSLLMEAEGTRVIFPGDSSARSDKILIPRWGKLLKCDIMQVSHHGHFGLSSDFYRLADADCLLFPVTEIIFRQDLPKIEASRTAIAHGREYYIASHGTAEIDLPYVAGGVRVLPDETNEDFNGVFNLWCYEYPEAYKDKLRAEYLIRSKKALMITDKRSDFPKGGNL